MITIGLAGWGDHDALYRTGIKPRDRLRVYSTYFTTVEVDSSFYAIQKEELYRRWASDTPDNFTFVVKAYQGMTGHQRGMSSSADAGTMFEAFKASIRPVAEAGKLAAVLFQYPPWFDCTRSNVSLLRAARERMGGLPCALEFRHRSWFEGETREKTLEFIRRDGWIHTVCDEPEAGPGSIPIVEAVSDPEIVVVRFHGRNREGWNSAGQSNWRDVRYLYRYSAEELAEWADRVRRLERQARTVCVLFNNNSGGDAADNALQFMAMLGMTPPRGSFETKPAGKPPEQMDLFDL